MQHEDPRHTAGREDRPIDGPEPNDGRRRTESRGSTVTLRRVGPSREIVAWSSPGQIRSAPRISRSSSSDTTATCRKDVDCGRDRRVLPRGPTCRVGRHAMAALGVVDRSANRATERGSDLIGVPRRHATDARFGAHLARIVCLRCRPRTGRCASDTRTGRDVCRRNVGTAPTCSIERCFDDRLSDLIQRLVLRQACSYGSARMVGQITACARAARTARNHARRCGAGARISGRSSRLGQRRTAPAVRDDAGYAVDLV